MLTYVQRRRQRGDRGAWPPWGNFGPPSANSSSAKKISCFELLHTIISRKPNEDCKILHSETSKSKKAFSFWARPQTPWPGALQMSPAPQYSPELITLDFYIHKLWHLQFATNQKLSDSARDCGTVLATKTFGAVHIFMIALILL